MAYDFSKLKSGLKEAEEHLARELSGIRTGRATPTLLDSVKAEAYGTRTPLAQLASISVEDARTLRITPWDKSVMKAIEKAIVDADLGVGVSLDDVGLRATFPELTAERRTALKKLVGQKVEEARVAERFHRNETVHELEASEKEGGMGEDELKRLKHEMQKLVDDAGAALAKLAEKKEAEISQ